MGEPKAGLVVAGRTLLERACAELAAGGCTPVFAVIRPGGAAPAGAVPVLNSRPERGMRSSLELAVAAAGELEALAVVPVDTPGVTAAAVRATVATWRPGRIAVASYSGRRAHPVVMGLPLWRTALSGAGADEGARALLRDRPELVDAVPVAGDPADLDRPADVAAWLRRHGG
jgi:molybdenum cofactor cytidylyltransferase/nicotine blue oxidoreductase